MPVDLTRAVGKHVFMQLKSPTYIIGKQEGQLMPLMMPDDSNKPVPVAVDYLIGKLLNLGTEEDPSIALSYRVPDGTRIQVMVEENMIQCVFWEDISRIEITSQMPEPIAKAAQS